MMPLEQWKRLAKPIIILAAIAFVLYAGWSLLLFIQRHGKVKLEINAAPTAMHLTLNGKKVKTTGLIYVSPGKINWHASFDGFQTKSGFIVVKKGEKPHLLVSLQPTGAAGEKWLKDHPTETYAIEGVVGRQHEEAVQKRLDSQPFTYLLPFIGPGFAWRVAYGATPKDAKYPDQPGIYVQSNDDQSKQDALDWIKAQHYDPDKMNIVYEALQGFGSN